MVNYFACIAIGNADMLPDEQIYVSGDTAGDLINAIQSHTAEFDSFWSPDGDGAQSDHPYRYSFNPPRYGESNYSQRLRIARDCDMVLDVIGMTQEEFERESGE